MPGPKLIAVITALIMIGAGSAVRAEYSLEQLQQIEALVMARDTEALLTYLQANPGILAGEDPLARELRGFAENCQDGLISCEAAPLFQHDFAATVGNTY